MITPAHSSNNDFIQKAAIKVADFSPGGVLLPQQAKEFVELAIVDSKLLQRCNTQIIPTSQYEIDKIGFTGQVLQPDEEDTALASDGLASPVTGKTTHVTKRYKAEIGLSYDTLKRTIKGDGLMPYLLGLLAKAANRDTELCALQGDTSLAATSQLNKLLRLQDGFIKQIVTNSVDAQGARVNLDLLDNMRIAMPDEYYEQEGLEYITTKNGLIHFEQAVSARATETGDLAFRSQNASSFHKIPVNAVPLMPKALTYNSVGGYATTLLCNPGTQFLVGYLEEMTIRTAEDVRAGKFIAVMRFDVSFKVLHEPACVKGVNVKNT